MQKNELKKWYKKLLLKIQIQNSNSISNSKQIFIFLIENF